MPTPAPGNEDEAVARFFADPHPDTWAALFRCFAGQVMRYFRARGCPVEDAEDLTQDVMLTVFRRHGQLREQNLFRPWLFRIARNAFLRRLERRGREESMPEEELVAPAFDPLMPAQFAEWMRALDPPEREAIRLRYVDGLEYHEIAEMLQVPLGTIQWRIFQAKRKLAARFGAAES